MPTTHTSSLPLIRRGEIPKIPQETQHLTKEKPDKLGGQNDLKGARKSLKKKKIKRKTKNDRLALPVAEGTSFRIRGLDHF